MMLESTMNARIVERVSNKRRCTDNNISLLKDASPMVTRTHDSRDHASSERKRHFHGKRCPSILSTSRLRNSNGAPLFSNFPLVSVRDLSGPRLDLMALVPPELRYRVNHLLTVGDWEIMSCTRRDHEQ